MADKQEHEYGRQIYYNDGECTMGAPEGSPRQLRYEKSNRWHRVFKTSDQRKETWAEADNQITEDMKPVKKPKRKKRKKSS